MRSTMRGERKERWGGLETAAVVGGAVVAFAITFVGATIMAILLYNLVLAESRLPLLEDGVGVLSIILGGWYAARRAEKSGWLHGGLAGLLYVAIAVTLGSTLYAIPFSALAILKRLGAGFLLGALGGVIGVNIGR